MSRLDGVETLSTRANENVHDIDHWAPLVNALANPWTRNNPDGLVILGIAENSLMHEELEEHIQKNFTIDRAKHFSYGHGPKGSPRLCQALAEFFNDRFSPLEQIESQNFLITSGVTAMIDHLTWCICDVAEGLLLPQPMYTGFMNDIPTRARGKLIPVPFERDDGSLDLDDVFDAQANLRCLERAYRKSELSGVKIKGVLISNPHNPLGKCYPVDTIKAIASFCARFNLHYLSDEIYAMSVFTNPKYPQATPFSSVLSIPLDDIIQPELVQVLYGASKDFCANGLRLGAFHSRNGALRAAIQSISTFAWEAYIVQDMWSRILEDKTFLNRFISENQNRLAKHYTILTNFLREHSISFFEGGNAGVFVWVDLRAWLLHSPTVSSKNAVSALKPSSSEFDMFKAKESLLSKTWHQKGVMIAKGSQFLSEELGWFRIVFTAEEDGLMIGLQRFIDVLQELK